MTVNMKTAINVTEIGGCQVHLFTIAQSHKIDAATNKRCAFFNCLCIRNHSKAKQYYCEYANPGFHKKLFRIVKLVSEERYIAVDCFVVTILELAACAASTSIIVPPMPCSANPVSNLPFLVVVGHSNNGAYEFVTEALDVAIATRQFRKQAKGDR